MVVTHATIAPVLMKLAEMREAIGFGAFIEFVSTPDAARLAEQGAAIRAIGPASVVLSSDLGQAGNPLPPDGFGDYIARLGRTGFTAEELASMTKRNPARLLGLP
jgi:hypothetical protein